jgi:TRAP transporter 4TM/12TM fusion protein
MKKAGYPPAIAGAIEAVASSGGQIIPPVMGAVAFVMAAFTGISYISICAAAVIPAVAYVACAAVSVELLAKRLGMVWQENPVDMRLLLTRMPLFLVPLASLTVLLVMDLSPMYAAVGGIFTLLFVSLFLRETRLSFHRLVRALVDGAVSAAPIAIACACVGIIVEILGFTGLDIRLPSMVEVWSQGYLFLALTITTLICILLGCGMPTIPIYVVVSITAAPVLIKMGVSLMAAHFFVLFLGVSAFITPPVAMAALVAAGIAESSYMKTAFQASRIGIMIYLIPFLYVYNPIILGQFAGHSILEVGSVLLSLFLGILTLCAALHGFYLRRANPAERLLMGASLLGFWGYIIEPSYLFFALGLTFLAAVTLAQMKGRRGFGKGVEKLLS